MRLFEVDIGAARDVLAVFQGLADKNDRPKTIEFRAVMDLIKNFHLGISTPDGLIALKNKIDPQGDVIKDITDSGDIILNTKKQDPSQEKSPKQPTGSSVDAMAQSGAKKLSPNI